MRVKKDTKASLSSGRSMGSLIAIVGPLATESVHPNCFVAGIDSLSRKVALATVSNVQCSKSSILASM